MVANIVLLQKLHFEFIHMLCQPPYALQYKYDTFIHYAQGNYNVKQ